MKAVASMMLAFMCGTAAMAQTKDDITISVGDTITIGDVNFDKHIDVADIANIISIMADPAEAKKLVIKASETEIKDTLPEKAVDLKLPSGTRWASVNLGAENPEDCGYYFAWGDTLKAEANVNDDARIFSWQNYKWMTGGNNSQRDINKYQVYDEMTSGCWFAKNSTGNYTFIGDNIPALLLEDDAAQHLWGGHWRMPTYEDFVELTTYCTTEWVTEDSFIGCKFTSKINGDSIFFPAAGYRDQKKLKQKEKYGYYWSATVNPTYTPYAQNLYISGTIESSKYYLLTDSPRYYGYSIRPVRKDVKKEEPKGEEDKQGGNGQEDGQGGNDPNE